MWEDRLDVGIGWVKQMWSFDAMESTVRVHCGCDDEDWVSSCAEVPGHVVGWECSEDG